MSSAWFSSSRVQHIGSGGRHPSCMATEWAGLVSNQAKPVEIYSQNVMSGVNTVATDERLRNFEPRLSDEDDTWVDNSPSKLPHHTNVRTFDLDVFNVHQLLFNAKLLWYQDSNIGHEFITMTIRLPWPQKKIASLKKCNAEVYLKK
ncbi:hypothetical protein TNCV_3763541 [Trichonephila clavipes]|uniref:Uncharacterized protein n=1 Tax=Trichonephila clavipes TaxID=2585209 RepID=A0A8X6VV94_TRICX|nr:hypothetical protein TNCV_3763541 [Trichonephila clavipes]